MSQNSDFVNYYQIHNLHLIRIAKSGPEAGKRPHDREWQRKPINYSVARQWSASGGNLGWCVGPNYLVIDIDPRNGGNESYDHLLTDLGIDAAWLDKAAPTVITGSGGRHVYLQKDPGLPIRPAPLKGYSGIDIKTGPAQVVIAGSTHPSGLPYVPDIKSTWPGAPISAPLPLIELLTRSSTAQPIDATPAANASLLYDCISLEQCAALLEHSNPATLESYEQWISRLAAIYHATAGAGLDLAIEWSSKDPEYSDVAEAQVRRRWRSFESPHDFPATVNTLIADVRDTPAAQPAVRDAKQAIALAEFDDLKRLERELKKQIDILPGGGWKSNQATATQIIRESLQLDAIAQDKLHKQLAKEVNEPYASLAKVVKAISKEPKEKKKKKILLHKFVLHVRDRTIKQIRESGQRIVRSPNGQYYIYNGRYWEPQSKEYVVNLVHKSTHELMSKNPNLTFESTGITSRAETSLCSEVFIENKSLFWRDNPPSVINTTNGTIWIDSATGEYELKPHYPGDYLTTQIDTPYDAEAKCPSFDIMLEQVFAHIKDDFQRSELIRHFWELIGYVIQPHKNIPLIMLWHGNGFNGKTTIADFLSGLIGPTCAQPVEMQELGSGKNTHALETIEGKLVLIDDDLKSDARLSDGTLKKFSETKLIQINPKFLRAYTARINVTPTILTNGFPIIRDLSEGLQRRMDVLPFKSNLTQYRKSELPKIARTQEMSGILNRALEGLKRVRVRGGFNRPQCALDANSEFFSESNNVAAFIKFATAPDPKGSCKMMSLFSDYVQFCIAHGERNQTERSKRFIAMVAQLGYEVRGETVYGLTTQMHDDDY